MVSAGREELPPAEEYDGYPQLENGVGMLRLLAEEVREDLALRLGDSLERRITLATGRLAAPFLENLLGEIRRKYPGLRAEVLPVENRFFGERITVSGLVTGGDLMEQLAGRDLGERLLIPCNMLRDGENVFLDDRTVEELEQKLGVPVQVVDEAGSALTAAVLEENTVMTHKRRQRYEQTDRSHCGPA